MFCFRRLRPCWKHPCGRLALLLFVLSFLGLVVLPHFIGHDMIIRFATYSKQQLDLKNQTSAPTENYPVLPGEGATESSITAVTAINTIVEIYDSKVDSTPSDENVKNEPMIPTTIATKNISSKDQNETQVVPEKFIFYVCDHKMYCYGLGDRQRGLISVYILAEVTKRTFGIIMTSPSNFTEFYKPNLVPWDIPPSKLKGRSSVEIIIVKRSETSVGKRNSPVTDIKRLTENVAKFEFSLAYGPKVNLGLKEIDFNKVYPQDVVYVRTNQKWQMDLLKNHHYRGKFPPWTKVATWQLTQVAWLRLMKPTETLRLELNEMLAHIAQKMWDEYDVYRTLNNSKCCKSRLTNYSNCTNSTCNISEVACCNMTASSANITFNCTNSTCIKTDTNNCTNAICTEIVKNSCTNQTCKETSVTTAKGIADYMSENCVKIVEDKTQNITEMSRLRDFATRYCNETRPVLKPLQSVESIRQSKGHDKVSLNLICVHVRLGHSATLPFEGNVRNHPKTVKAVWAFLKPYVAQGRHVYLATDAQVVRQEAKAIIGDRVHVSSVPIAHIAIVKKDQDKRTAFSLTLVEQLLLITSCKTLVVSYSGFSMKAAQIRNQLGTWGELFMFKNGVVEGKGVHWLLR